MSTTVTIHYDSRKIRTWNPPQAQPVEIVRPQTQPQYRTVMRPRFMGDDFVYVPTQELVRPAAPEPSAPTSTLPSQGSISSFLAWLFGA